MVRPPLVALVAGYLGAGAASVYYALQRVHRKGIAMFTFAETDIRAGANDQSFRRGSAYFADNAVFDLVQRGNLLTAQVAGSGDEPYQVVVG